MTRSGVVFVCLLFLGFPAIAEVREQTFLDQWPDSSRIAAEKLLERYGVPDEATASQLTWKNQGPWARITVHRTGPDHLFPFSHRDIVEQSIRFRVPPERLDELAELDGSLVVQRTVGELTSTSESEPMNFLAINLAREVSTGLKTVEEAKEDYIRFAREYVRGETPAYTIRLQFKLSEAPTGDPGELAFRK